MFPHWFLQGGVYFSCRAALISLHHPIRSPPFEYGRWPTIIWYVLKVCFFHPIYFVLSASMSLLGLCPPTSFLFPCSLIAFFVLCVPILSCSLRALENIYHLLWYAQFLKLLFYHSLYNMCTGSPHLKYGMQALQQNTAVSWRSQRLAQGLLAMRHIYFKLLFPQHSISMLLFNSIFFKRFIYYQ